VRSPIDGQVGRYMLTVGNLVNQDQTLLTTVVSQDPMYVYFDMDEATLLKLRKAVDEGRIKQYQEGKVPVFMGLQGEDGYPHEGTLNFVNNQVNPNTGSIAVRGRFDNPILKGTVRLFSPGMFTRIHLPMGPPHDALLVIDRAIGSDQGLKYVYVIENHQIEKKNGKEEGSGEAVYRRVTTGALQPDGLRVITGGLQPGEWVAVGALQQLRPHLQVQTDVIRPMPSLGQPAKKGGE
jgi:multidrug efflux system membrane fusion protein